jgi:CheY-like chemotaxis protein
MSKLYDVLVIEDEPVVLSAIQKIFGPERLRMDEAVDSKSALSKLSQNAYRLIISDLMLPKISGHDFIQIVKEKYPAIPLIVITGYATLENAVQSFQFGSFDFIPKPFETEALLGVVKRGLKYSDRTHALRSNKPSPLPPSPPLESAATPGNMYSLGRHAWVKFVEEGAAVVGVGDTFPNMIEGLEGIEFHASNDEIVQGKCCAQFISQSGLVNIFWAPLSGRVTASNRELENDVQLINSQPFEKGWIFHVVPYNPEEELKHLTFCGKGMAP